MSNLAEKLASSGHLTDEQVAAIKERSHQFVKAAMADPKLLEDTNEKLGGFLGDLARGFKDVFRPAEQVASGVATAGLPYAVGSSVGRALPGTLGTRSRRWVGSGDRSRQGRSRAGERPRREGSQLPENARGQPAVEGVRPDSDPAGLQHAPQVQPAVRLRPHGGRHLCCHHR